MKKLSFILLPIVLAGCSTTSTSDTQKEKHWDPHMTAYVLCNREKSAQVSRQAGDPLSLGIAVTAMCGGQADMLRKAFTDTNNARFADRMMNTLEREQARFNAATIVKARGLNAG